ncbi:MAG: bifunctional DNA-formamidopyrimidine glycosylase/DNA-(apurinic or apyrimidinic site) lyase [Pseudomonadota bacterium]
MPELPEVETVRRGLAPVMEGARIDAVYLARPDLRFPFPHRFAKRLTGRRMDRLQRRAKYLIGVMDDGTALIMHLGMSGAFRINDGGNLGLYAHPNGKLAAHDHVRFSIGPRTVIYNDPRRFGFMTLCPAAELDTHPHFKGMGTEPLRGALTAQVLARAFAGKTAPLKAALLDQKVIAGLGNIYVCEALWRAGLSPRRLAGSLVKRNGLPTARLTRLVDAIISVIEEAIEAGGSSLRDYVAADGSMGRFQHAFAVYGREGDPCPSRTCNGAIKRIVQSNRSTFFCPACQK